MLLYLQEISISSIESKENYFKPEHINVIKCDLMQRKDIESLQAF